MALKKIETALAADNPMCNRQNLVRILDGLRLGIVAHDLEQRIFFINRAAERITGLSRREVIGKDCRTAFGVSLYGDRCNFGGAKQRFDHPRPAHRRFSPRRTAGLAGWKCP